jgi:glycosyltransferase involved in cell wall biosynthesis
MKILMLTDYDAGGTWNIATPVAEEVRLAGHEVTLRATGKDGCDIKDLPKHLEAWDVVHFWNIRTRRYFDPAPPSVLTIHHLLAPPQDNAQYDALRSFAPEAIHVVDRFTQHGLGRAGFTNVVHIPQAFRHEKWEHLPPPEEFAIGYMGDAGSDKRFEVVEGIAKKLGIPCHSLLSAPWKSDAAVMDFYRKISVYVVASFCDGGPLPAQEAYLCGRPVVSTRVGMMEDVACEFFDGSVEDGARAVAQVREDYELESICCFEEALPTVGDVIPDYLALYERLAA